MSHVAECPDLGAACVTASPPAPYVHHVKEIVAESSFDASLALTSWFAVDTRWSVRMVRVIPTYAELDGRPKSVPDDIHHHDETVGGVTDPWLLARFGAAKGPFVSTARLGLSLPVGQTVADPYALGREGRWHEHLQQGTGTFVPIVSFGLAYTVAPAKTVAPVTLTLGGTGLFNAYENAKRYRAPVRAYLNHRVSVGLVGEALRPFVDATLAHEGEEYWSGRVGGEGTNVRTELYLGGGLGVRVAKGWDLEAKASGRVASFTDAATFRSAGVFSLALTAKLDVFGTTGQRRAKPE